GLARRRLVLAPGEYLRYTWIMETVVYRIRELSRNERSAAEQLVGHVLRDDQQLFIQVVEPEAASAGMSSSGSSGPSPPPWENIYRGLSDERIDELDNAIRQRANLTRINE